MSFYMTLPSNVISKYHENKQNNYTTFLDTPLNLHIPYEVALVEFSYREFMLFEIGTIQFYKIENNVEKYEEPYTITCIDNESLQHFVNRINAEFIKKYKGSNKPSRLFTLNDKRNEILITVGNNDGYILTGYFGYIFNANHLTDTQAISNTIENFSIKYTAAQNTSIHTTILPDHFNFIDHMLILTDIIEYQYIGNTKIPVLRNVVKTGEYNKTIEKIYTEPHYVNVNKSFIPSINIQINDSNNIPIKFKSETSHVYCKLHFRPKQYE